MKLLIIHNKYQSNNIGGEDIVYKNELESLQKRLGKENVFSYEVSNDNIHKIKLLYQIWFSYTHYKNIKKIISKHKIDLVHIHNFFPLLTPSVFKAAKDCNAKVIHTLHNYRLWCISGIFYRDNFGICEQCIQNKFSFTGIWNKCYRKSITQSFVTQIAFWFYKTTKMFKYIDYFFVLTNFQKKKVQALGIADNKIILKPNSLTTPISYINNIKKNYLYIGRLEEAKGIYELLNIWETLEEKFILTIIGTGEIEKSLRKKYAKKNIIFKGQCDRETTMKHIASSKYLINTSLMYETFGLTIIEAMSHGVPVIGLDIGTRKDFIQHGVNGFLAQKTTFKDLIEHSYNYKDYNNMSKNAIKTAELYQNDYIINKQINIYKQIMEQKS